MSLVVSTRFFALSNTSLLARIIGSCMLLPTGPIEALVEANSGDEAYLLRFSTLSTREGAESTTTLRVSAEGEEARAFTAPTRAVVFSAIDLADAMNWEAANWLVVLDAAPLHKAHKACVFFAITWAFFKTCCWVAAGSERFAQAPFTSPKIEFNLA
eukprot:Lithocolla_globosa_v1_NODE_805_length_3253_cov_31.566604.p2 type:complete len:157 gc:universal NODE_805_length_3253_cov_31.566604:551-81(-)